MFGENSTIPIRSCSYCSNGIVIAFGSEYYPDEVFCSPEHRLAYEDAQENAPDDEISMTFDEALALVDAISDQTGWSAEIAASGMDDDEYITVQACYDKYGLIYQVDLETVEEWQYHRQRIDDWQKGKGYDHIH